MIWKKRDQINNNDEDWQSCREIRNFVTNEYKRVKKQYFKTQINNNKGNSEATWKVLHDQIRTKSRTSQINNLDDPYLNYPITDPKDIASHLVC